MTLNLDASEVDSLGQLVDSDIGGRAHKNGTFAKLDEVVDHRCRRDRLARARWSLMRSMSMNRHRLWHRASPIGLLCSSLDR